MEYLDQYYTDQNGGLHFLSAQDQANAITKGLLLPDPSWTAITEAAAALIQNPPLTLSQAQAAQIATLQASYNAATLAPVSMTTAAGHTDTYAQDAQSKQYLLDALAAGAKNQTWPLNIWLNSAGQPVTPFIYADLQTLSTAMEAAEIPAYQDLLAKVAAVMAAVQAGATVAAVQAIVF